MQFWISSCLVVGAGGALGAIARYLMNVTLQSEGDFPWGTLGANLVGCLVMGVIAEIIANAYWLENNGVVPEHYRLLFAVGFCGAFTTLSSFVLEISAMVQRNEFIESFAYFMATMAGGFACFLCGLLLTRQLLTLLFQGSS